MATPRAEYSTEISQKYKIVETIDWKTLEEHFLMVHVPLVFRFNHFQEKNAFF
jgi:hypothetical protein